MTLESGGHGLEYIILDMRTINYKLCIVKMELSIYLLYKSREEDLKWLQTLGNYHGHHGQEGSLEEGAGGVFNINIFYLIYINKERGRNLSLFKI